MFKKIDLRKYKNTLSDKAFNANNSKGRKDPIIEDGDVTLLSVMDPYIVDIIKLYNSKALRRLQNTSQVFCEPLNPHIRTRRSHTDEVVGLSVAISDILGLNTYLTQAIALGHDIGHPPFGHQGERFISEKTGQEFRHEIFSVIIAQFIERKGFGLNLTYETLEGFLAHSRTRKSLTLNSENGHPLEYDVVMFADKIAGVSGDFSDFKQRTKINVRIPDFINDIGRNQEEIVVSCATSLIKESSEEKRISFSKSGTAENFTRMRQWLVENFYKNIDNDLYTQALESVYNYLESESKFQNCDPAMLLALMTDKEVNHIASLFLKGIRPNYNHLSDLGFIEIIPHIENRNINFTDPQLDWANKNGFNINNKNNISKRF